jgi:hypothetical protein
MVHKVKEKMLGYDEAIVKMALLEDRTDEVGRKLNAFDRSVVMAVLYNVPKEQTLDDIVRVRQAVFVKKK